MANRKIKIQLNPLNSSPGLSDAFENFDSIDDEIQPKMIEVWDGKRIAWAIAILSALIILPAVYLLFDSYSEDDNKTSTNQGLYATTVDTETSSASQPVTQEASAVSVDPAMTEPEPVVEYPEPGARSDTQTKENEPLKSVIAEANPKAQPDQTETVNDEQQTPISPATLSPVVASPESSQTENSVSTGIAVSTESQKSENSAIVPDLGAKTMTLQPKVKLSQGINSLDVYQYLQSKHINRALLVTDVHEREPVGENIDSIQVDNRSVTRLFYFTEVKGMEGQSITYRWLYGDKPVFSKTIPVTGNYSWRSYTSKLIPYSMLGNWRVEVLDSHGHLLAKQDFTVKRMTDSHD